MKRIGIIALFLSPLLIIGCGGGGNNTTSNILPKVKLTGSVPGTFIEAYCNDGTYASTHSIQNGTSQHPFTLNVPKNVPCKIIMTTNENNASNRVITPIKVNGKSSIKLRGDTDLGYVNLPKSYNEATDNDGDHVNDIAIDVTPASFDGEAIDDNSTNNPFDKDHNGKIDTLEDKNHNNIPDGWEDHNHDNKPDIFNDNNHNGKPDSIDEIENNHTQDSPDSQNNNN